MFNALRADNSPFTEQQIERLKASLGELDMAQSVWLSGYIAGSLSGTNLSEVPSATQPASQPVSQESLKVYYASQTGNGEDLANSLAEEARQAGLAVEVSSLASLRPAALKKLDNAAFIISTHGEGDPPDDAIDLFEYLQGPRAAKLDKLNFRVLALGDRSYNLFCEAGRKLESLLLAKGASTFAPRVDCDLDYHEPAASWTGEVISYGLENIATDDRLGATISSSHLSIVPPTSRWTRENPFSGTVERVQKITGLESEKDVYHLEISLEDSDLQYQPGDALGVWAPNQHELVNEILETFDINCDEELVLDGHRHTIHELLVRQREITRLSPDTIERYAELAKQTDLSQKLEEMDGTERRSFIERRQFADLLREFPPAANINADQLAGLLRPLTPRSYSIASSQAEVDEEVHLTVATLHSNALGVARRGVASDFLNHHVEPGDEVNVFLEPNRRFRLPENKSTPLILIAAGTGVAPYRAFLQQLDAEGESPDTWLIFGNPHFRTDFLYQREWLEWRKNGLLNQIDGAFSRDQEEKRYVQHVVAEKSEQIDAWLGRGASIYICGGLAMGKEVELALRDALQSQRRLTPEQAAEQLSGLRRDGRLMKDLY